MPAHVTRSEAKKHPGVLYNDARERWEQRVTIDGSRHLFSAKTAAEVAAKVRAAQERAARGLVPVEARRTVGAYLEWWATEILPMEVAASTLETYRHIIHLYIAPHIGSLQLAKLAPADVSRMLGRLERGDPTARPPRQPVSPNTRRAARSVLRRALRRAEQEGIVARNVAAIADGVRVPQPEGRTLDPQQARQFLAHTAEHRLGPVFAVMLSLGLRRGETLGLAWPDVALDTTPPTITVQRSLKRLQSVGLSLDQPKTRSSRRTLHLPQQLADVLVEHRRRQAAERDHAGPEWVAMPLGVDLVFRTPFGTAIDPANFRNATYAATVAAGIGRWSPHELRHSAASILLAMGVPLKTVSETLGHSSIRVTADVYAHLLAPARQDAADAAGRALW